MSSRYAVRLDAPARPTAAIELTVPVRGDSVELALPAWSPGSYLIRDYARFVRDLDARDGDGEPRRVKKLDKSRWRVEARGARELVVRYAVYGHDLTVRTNHID